MAKDRDETDTLDSSTGARRSGSRGAAIGEARVKVARIVGLVFSLIALLLAIGAVLVALGKNVDQANSVVKAILSFDDAVSGPLGRDHGVFTFHGKNALAKDALVNWGIAALVYLFVGRLLARLIRG